MEKWQDLLLPEDAGVSYNPTYYSPFRIVEKYQTTIPIGIVTSTFSKFRLSI